MFANPGQRLQDVAAGVDAYQFDYLMDGRSQGSYLTNALQKASKTTFRDVEGCCTFQVGTRPSSKALVVCMHAQCLKMRHVRPTSKASVFCMHVLCLKMHRVLS